MRTGNSRDYHRFVDAPPEAGFTTEEIAAAYGVGRTALTRWGLTLISKVGKHHIYRKSDVIKKHGAPPMQYMKQRHRRPRANGNSEHHVPKLGEKAPQPEKLPPADALRVLYPVDVRRVQAAFREELECALAPLLTILDSHSSALAKLVQLGEHQLELWKPRKGAAS